LVLHMVDLYFSAGRTHHGNVVNFFAKSLCAMFCDENMDIADRNYVSYTD